MFILERQNITYLLQFPSQQQWGIPRLAVVRDWSLSWYHQLPERKRLQDTQREGFRGSLEVVKDNMQNILSLCRNGRNCFFSGLPKSHSVIYDFFQQFTWKIHKNAMDISTYSNKRCAKWAEDFVTSMYFFSLSICDSCMAVSPSSI